MTCPFCDDIKRQPIIIYKDDLVISFRTNIPIVTGHVLVCPARHVEKIDQLSEGEFRAIKDFIIKLKTSLAKSLGAEGFNIAWNEGKMAGQAIDHLHIHVVPRKIGDTGIYEYDPRKFLYRPGSRKESPKEELQEIAELIRKSLE